MKTFISNKQQSESGYENQLLNKLDQKNSHDYIEPQEGPFNTQLADQLKALFKKEPKVETKNVIWTEFTIDNS